VIETQPAVPPSEEVLSDVARRVSSAYPDLFAHQRSGVAFLMSRRRAILADDRGLGKTRQAIVALREVAPTGPVLVICPAGVKLNWGREIELVEPGADVLVVRTSTDFERGHRWTVVNYDLLSKLEKGLLGSAWSGMVIDEAHYIKNDSQRSKRVLKVLAASDPEGVYLLTGTPMSNRPRDLFNLLQGVRHPLANSFYSYAKRYCGAFDNGHGLDTNGASNLEELAELVSGVMLRRTKDEALDLPPKVRTWQPVEVKSAQVASLESRALDFLEKNPARTGPTWVRFLGLLNRARHTLAVQKAAASVEALKECIENEEKAVLFTSYQAVVDKALAAFGPQAVSITGSDSARKRQQAADRLQGDPSVRVLVGNLQAAGVGINLTAATHVIFNDLDWVPGNHWQAEDRIYRIGQTRPAFVTYLYAGRTLDDFVAALLEQKARNIGVLEAEAADNASLVQLVVDAAVRGDRPAFVGSEPATVPAGRSVGLLEEALDLLARARRGLGSIAHEQQEIRVPSKSKPGSFHTLRISGGVATCECRGFEYRGNCSHVREAIKGL
jgi:SNF2 family DNA or RNA helicase